MDTLFFVVKDREDGEVCGYLAVERGDDDGATVETVIQDTIDEAEAEFDIDTETCVWDDLVDKVQEVCESHGWKAKRVYPNKLFY